MRKVLLLDKNGTLVKPRSDSNFVQDPWDQEAIPDVKQKLEDYQEKGWECLIISNQGGIGAGYKTIESTINEMRFCLELFPQIKEAFFCPDFQGDECYRVWGKGEESQILYNRKSWGVAELGIEGKFRKPNPGMLILAAHLYGAEKLLMIGTREEDALAASKAKIKFLWHEEWLYGIIS